MGLSKKQEFFNNCYRVILWQRLGEFAAILGYQEDARRCLDRLSTIRPLIHKTWFDPEKQTYRCNRQAYLAIALQSRIMPEELRPVILQKLEETIRAKGGHLDTGIHGTNFLLELLAEEGRHDLIAGKTNYPSWGFLIEKRRVTTWPETWTGWGSQVIGTIGNHGSWFYEGLAGIRPAPEQPGFKNVILKPALVDEGTWVKAHPYGRIVSEWKRDGDRLTLTVEIPPTRPEESLFLSGKTTKSPPMESHRSKPKACSRLSEPKTKPS